MKVYITGAGGFLGKELIRQLGVQNEKEIYALTSQIDRMEAFAESYENVRVVGKNAIIDGKTDFNPDDVLINCAFPRTLDDFEMSGGLDYTQKTLSAAVRAGAHKIINISSQSVYDASRTEPAKETDYLVLQSKYAVGKYATELMLHMLEERCACTNIRLASLIGPGFDQRLTNKMADFAIERHKLSAEQSDQRFGFLDVEDAARGIIRLLDQPADQWESVYNLGSDSAYSLEEIAQTIAELMQAEWNTCVEITYTQGDKKFSSALDNTRLKNCIGQYQQVDLKESMRRIIALKMKRRNDA